MAQGPADVSVSRTVSVAVDGPLGRVCRPAIDYVMPALPSGVHQGLASPWLTMVITLAGPVVVQMPDRDGVVRRTEFEALVSGLCPSAVELPMVGEQRGIQIDISPLAGRQIFGLPVSEIAYLTVDLVDILGVTASELTDRLPLETDPEARVATITGMLNDRIAASSMKPVRPELAHAWTLIQRHHGDLRVAHIADETGWSRRHLAQEFTREFGLGPKEISRIARFEHASSLVRRGGHSSLAQVAARAGYADQAHFTAEWKALAGCSPTEWIRRELPFLQDSRVLPAAS